MKGISWVGVDTADFQKTLSFFTDVIGLEPAVVDESGVALLHAGKGQIVEIFGAGTRGQALTSPPAIAFEVEDVAAARDELASHGVELIGDIGAWNGFEWAYFRGPDNYVYAIKKTPAAGWEKADAQ